jgi:hypothetical protein
MPKAICLISLVASILVVVLFFADMAMGFLGMEDMAPLRSADKLMDLVFVIAGAALISMSWMTYREQR